MRQFFPIEFKKDVDAEKLAFDCEFKFVSPDDETKAGEIEGYGSIFSVMDNGGDIILPGAFKKSIAEWRKRKAFPPMLWQHRCDQPIGVWTSLEEDEKGLKCTGELILDIEQGATAHALLKRNAIKGLSIGYRSVKDDHDPKTFIRTIKEAELWEISLVTFPMNPKAAVTAVKGESPVLTERDMEEAFRDGGLSNREAKIAVSIWKKKMVLREGETPEQPHRDGAGDLLLATRRLKSLIS